MAGGGIGAAILSLKQNRVLVKKRKLKDKTDVYGKPDITILDLKESTLQDMKIIRKKIKLYKREERQNWWLAFFLTFGLFCLLYIVFLK